ncbi:hypothetical protein A3709_06125 [Halioglobus sp. HI00S01]|uniref:DUF1415 domain-containing protein n=1 Tax=Halioglobus sp. HI00S01 TaxID=1822214 RepID=UPI0007C2B546|nr:DUF1415 domain-containing protein [Halioglobus sp. HI00S01]KZX55968.1 hypothetical protein A3709_06125 [Halioglobus sp. HI00S01]
MPDRDAVERQTRAWLTEFVVGLNLCPFARPVLDSPALRVAVCDKTEGPDLLRAFLLELDLLQSTPEEDVATTLLVFANALQSFDDYLDLLADAQDLLHESGLEGVIQLASFHPDYLFDGEDPAATSHFSNRAPWPTIHFLREDMLSRVLGDYPDPEAIPQRNMQTLASIGLLALKSKTRELREGS